MKCITLPTTVLACILVSVAQPSHATGLMEVYSQALKSDPSFQEALSKRMAAEEKLPQAQSALLPTMGFEADASIVKGKTINNGLPPPKSNGEFTATQRALNFRLDLKQAIFNWTSWESVSAAKNTVKAAMATYNADAQNLIQRTVKAYFQILQDREILRVCEIERKALYNEYQRASESFKVGLKTITDVYDAKAAYSQADAQYIEAQNALETSKENLRTITGVYYNDLDWLKQEFPLVSPAPANIEKWVQTATQQNWGLQAAKLGVIAACDNISAEEGGHLPTLGVSAGYSNSYSRTLGDGNMRQKGPSAALTLEVPLYSGGYTSSKVREAMANYQRTVAQHEQAYRSVVNNTRTSYLGVMSTIKQIKADIATVQSTKSSLEGTQEGYKVGIRTIIDVLNAERAYYEAQKAYAIDRFGYINNLIGLKMAAGTLSERDILDIDRWLGKTLPAKK